MKSTLTLLEKFELRIQKTDSCWIWVGNINKNTHYGMLNGDYAHRISYRLFTGEIPDGYWIDHLCRVRACANPEHLEAVTPQENLMRKPLSEDCPKGHNEWRIKRRAGRNDTRDCKQCHRDRERNRKRPGEHGWDEQPAEEAA